MSKKKNEIHYVYKITDPKTKQFYFGSRSCTGNPENDNYMGSMVTWKPEDKDRLQKEIIKDDFETRENAIEFEDEIIGKYIDDKLNENYHRPNGTVYDGMVGKKHTEKTKQKLREYYIGKTWEEIHGKEKSKAMKKKLSNSLRGKNHPMYGKNQSNEAKNKMKEKAKGRWTLKWFEKRYGKGGGAVKYENHCKKIRKATEGINSGSKNGMHGKDTWMKGKKHSKEIIEKFKKDRKGRFTLEWFQSKYGKDVGIKKYNERCNRLSNSALGSGNPRATKVVHVKTGKEFDTMSEAACWYGCSSSTITRHCKKEAKNPKFMYL